MPDAKDSTDATAATDAALDELYGAAPEQFVTTRDRLVKELRAAGVADAAASLRALRRPTVVAWSVNQAARTRGDLVEALFDATDELREAVAAGDGDTVRAAMRMQRARATALTDVAVEHAATLSPKADAHRDAIAATWEAAAGDDTLRPAVAAGRLTTELRPGSTFGDATPAAPRTTSGAGRSSASTRARARRARLPRDELATRRAEEALATARAELADATARAERAEADLADAERVAAEHAHDARRRAERHVEQAERALAERTAR